MSNTWYLTLTCNELPPPPPTAPAVVNSKAVFAAATYSDATPLKTASAFDCKNVLGNLLACIELIENKTGEANVNTGAV